LSTGNQEKLSLTGNIAKSESDGELNDADVINDDSIDVAVVEVVVEVVVSGKTLNPIFIFFSHTSSL